MNILFDFSLLTFLVELDPKVKTGEPNELLKSLLLLFSFCGLSSSFFLLGFFFPYYFNKNIYIYIDLQKMKKTCSNKKSRILLIINNTNKRTPNIAKPIKIEK